MRILQTRGHKPQLLKIAPNRSQVPMSPRHPSLLLHASYITHSAAESVCALCRQRSTLHTEQPPRWLKQHSDVLCLYTHISVFHTSLCVVTTAILYILSVWGFCIVLRTDLSIKSSGEMQGHYFRSSAWNWFCEVSSVYGSIHNYSNRLKNCSAVTKKRKIDLLKCKWQDWKLATVFSSDIFNLSVIQANRTIQLDHFQNYTNHSTVIVATLCNTFFFQEERKTITKTAF